jgi:hypothetical protein
VPWKTRIKWHFTTDTQPIQTGPRAHPAFCAMGTGSLSRGVKRPGRGVDHPPQSPTAVKEGIELYVYFLSGPSCPVLGWALPWLYFTLLCFTLTHNFCVSYFILDLSK